MQKTESEIVVNLLSCFDPTSTSSVGIVEYRKEGFRAIIP